MDPSAKSTIPWKRSLLRRNGGHCFGGGAIARYCAFWAAMMLVTLSSVGQLRLIPVTGLYHGYAPADGFGGNGSFPFCHLARTIRKHLGSLFAELKLKCFKSAGPQFHRFPAITNYRTDPDISRRTDGKKAYYDPYCN